MQVLPYISTIFVLLPLILFFLFFQRNQKAGLRVILIYIVASFLTDQIHNSARFANQNNLILHIFTIIEYSLISLYIFLVIPKKPFRISILVLSACFYIFAIFFDRNFLRNEFDSLASSIECILIVIYCIFFFFVEINKPDISLIYSRYNFWAVTGFLIYFSGTLFLFISAAGQKNEEDSLYWKIINSFCSIIENICLSVAFIMKKNNEVKPVDPFADLNDSVFRE